MSKTTPDRKQRLAQQLRENLRKRKAQARARSAGPAPGCGRDPGRQDDAAAGAVQPHPCDPDPRSDPETQTQEGQIPAQKRQN